MSDEPSGTRFSPRSLVRKSLTTYRGGRCVWQNLLSLRLEYLPLLIREVERWTVYRPVKARWVVEKIIWIRMMDMSMDVLRIGSKTGAAFLISDEPCLMSRELALVHAL